MRIFTTFQTCLFYDPVAERLLHSSERKHYLDVSILAAQKRCIVAYDDKGRLASVVRHGDMRLSRKRRFGGVSSGVEVIPLDIAWLERTESFGIRHDDRFMCAEPDGRISMDRPHCGSWETFTTRRLALSRPLLHIFGDSHSLLYASVPGAAICHLGPVTMFRVGRDGVRTFDFASRDIKNGDALGFVFGEIDVRVHVELQKQKLGRQPEEVIYQLVGNYMTTLRFVRRLYNLSPIVVFSSVPPAANEYPNFDQKLPRHGTNEDRAAWTILLNSLLKPQAQECGFGFIDQYSGFHNASGMLDLSYSEDGVHLSRGLAYLIDWNNIFKR